MINRSLAIVVGLVLGAACGGSGNASGANGPTASSVAVQSSDLPAGMVRCDLSGDIDSFLAKEKTQDQSTYESTSTDWTTLKNDGATAASTSFYADNAAHCTAIKSSGYDIGTASYKLAVNFVTQFKDEKSATNAYTNDSIFGFQTSQLRTGGLGLTEGAATGLTANSIVISAPISNQSFYIAMWQSKTFVVILAILNVDTTASKKVATLENGRIK
ncbi:MAG TPA: hypothetical protein VMW11_00700 [Candidatus Dormibacteraeota bacterium]|nr:hypothetical protein [Candidatus Dormibacteraeota bacterium]